MTAAKNKAATDNEPNGTTPDLIPEEWEWETVAKESPTKVVFEKTGEAFAGTYEGVETITPDNGDDPFDLHVFERGGSRYAVNSSYKLNRALHVGLVGKMVRLTYVQDIGGTKGNPMKDFRVDVRK